MTVKIPGTTTSGASTTVYQVLFIFLTLFCAAASLVRPIRRVGGAQRLWHFLLLCVLVETGASILGGLLMFKSVAVRSEGYYLIQRLNVIVIPLAAQQFGVRGRVLLRALIGAVIAHLAFTLLQFWWTDAYCAMVVTLYDPVRGDNAWHWCQSPGSLDFLGLQNTANYASFAAAFGLLALGLRPKKVAGRLAVATLVISSIAIVYLSPSRAVILMSATALLVFLYKRRLSTVVFVSLFVMIGLSVWLDLRLSNAEHPLVPSAFVAEDKESSTLGKLDLLNYGWTMVGRSPVVGWGATRFESIRDSTGGLEFLSDTAHSYVLTLLTSTGLVGTTAAVGMSLAITIALWRRRERDHAIVCGLMLGLCVYSVIYDAGSLDLFACFVGVAATYALGVGGATQEALETRRLPVGFGADAARRRLSARASMA